jgi:hypothetical protein
MISTSVKRQQGSKFGRLPPATESERAVSRAPSNHQQEASR